MEPTITDGSEKQKEMEQMEQLLKRDMEPTEIIHSEMKVKKNRKKWNEWNSR